MPQVKASFLLQDTLVADQYLWSKSKLVISRLLNGLEQICTDGSLPWASVNWRWDILADTSKLPVQYSEKLNSRNSWMDHGKESFMSFCQDFRRLSQMRSSQEARTVSTTTFYKSLISSSIKNLCDQELQVSKIITPARLKKQRENVAVLSNRHFLVAVCDAKMYNDLFDCLPADNTGSQTYSFVWIIIDSIESITRKRACDRLFTIRSCLSVSAQLFVSVLSRRKSVIDLNNGNAATSAINIREFDKDIITMLSVTKSVGRSNAKMPRTESIQKDIMSTLESLFKTEQIAAEAFDILQENVAEESLAVRTAKEETFMELGSLFRYYLYHEEPISEFIGYFSKYKESLRKTLKSKYAAKIIDSGLRDVMQSVEFLKTHWMSHVFDFLSEKSSPAPALLEEEQEYLMRSSSLWKQNYKKDDFIPNYCRTMMCRSYRLIFKHISRS